MLHLTYCLIGDRSNTFDINLPLTVIFVFAVSECPDETASMRRLNLVFAGVQWNNYMYQNISCCSDCFAMCHVVLFYAQCK